MSWKKDNLLKNLSISLRLTFLYSLSTLLILIIISVLLHKTLKENLMNEGERFLLGEYQVLKNMMLKQYEDNKSLQEEIMWEPTLSIEDRNRYYIRILNSNRKILLETPGAEEVIPTNIRKYLRYSLKGPKIKHLYNKKYKKNVLFLYAAMKLNSGQYQYIQIALKVKRELLLLKSYRKILITVIILGTIISILSGILLTRRSLQPLKNITRTITHISTDQLHERLDPKHWPAELATLANGFNMMLDRLEESFQRLRQFSADLAHELRTPINNLRGEAEICLSKTRTPEEYQQVLESSLEEYNRLSQMISGLLFLAKAANSDTLVKREKIYAREIIDSVCDLYAAMAEEKNIIIECDGNGIVIVDPMLFRRALNNLLANAIKYTHTGGKIFISAHNEKEKTKITIQDTGIGIEPEHLPHIFDRFYRTDTARTQSSGGLGLGLAIVQSIMKLHAGEVYIESEPNHGTKITLIFPKK